MKDKLHLVSIGLPITVISINIKNKRGDGRAENSGGGFWGIGFYSGDLFLGAAVYYFKINTYAIFKNCSVEFKYYAAIDTADAGYRIAKRKLALCLCNAYADKTNLKVGKQIIKIHQQYGKPIAPQGNNSLDSIIKYRATAFDTVLVSD